MKHSLELRRIFRIIRENDGEARFVGGAVRDFLLEGKPLEGGDVDLAANLPPEVVAIILTNAGAKVITKYATNIVVLNNRVFEITSTRKDENCDGRYAKMIFTSSFKEDSCRRDFTINALYLSEFGEIFDFHEGLDDIKNQVVRFIGPPLHRIEEDILRIWRFFRFSCLYAKKIDSEGLHACFAKKESLKNLSKERITAEMMKLIMGSPKKVCETIDVMINGGILQRNDFNLKLNLPEDPFLRLAVLTNANEIGEFLYTTKQRKFLRMYGSLRSMLRKKSELYRLYYTIPQKDLRSILTLGEFLGESENINVLFEEFATLPSLPFSNKTIMEDGFKGADISKEYNERLTYFIKNLSRL